MTTRPIQLSLIGETAFCFNADGKWPAKNSTTFHLMHLTHQTRFLFSLDYMKIRTEHRIIGRLIGSTVRWPRNSNFNGEHFDHILLSFFLHDSSLSISTLGLPAIYSPYETQLLIDKGIVQLCKRNFSDVPNEQFEKQYEEFRKDILKEGQEAYLAKRIEDATAKMDQILTGKRKKVAKSGGEPNEVTEETILEDVRTRAINEAPNIVHVQVPTQEPFDVGKSA